MLCLGIVDYNGIRFMPKFKFTSLFSLCVPITIAMMTLGCASFLTAKESTQKSPSVELRGELQQGNLVRGKVPVGTQVLLNNKSVRVDDNGDFAIGFDRNAVSPQSIEFIYANGSREAKTLQIKPKEYRIQNVKGISKQIMQPSAAHIARAKKDGAEVWQARNTNSNLNAFASHFIWPLTGRISGVYGSQRIYNDVPSRPHYGVDVAAPTGTEVVAPADGVITLSVPDMFYSGGTLIIDHGYGVSSSFLHLSQLLVSKGDKVKQGQVVAKVGTTGRSTGPHLDWRINWYQMRLDPTSVVPSMESVLAAESNHK